MTSLAGVLVLLLAAQLCACASLDQPEDLSAGLRDERQAGGRRPLTNQRSRTTTTESTEGENATPSYPGDGVNATQGAQESVTKPEGSFSVEGRNGGNEETSEPPEGGERKDEFGRNQQGLFRPSGNQGFGQGRNQGFGQGGSQGFGQGGSQGFGQGGNRGFGQEFGQGGSQGGNQGFGQGGSQGGNQGFGQGGSQGGNQGFGQGGSQGGNQGFGQGGSQEFGQGGNQGFGPGGNEGPGGYFPGNTVTPKTGVVYAGTRNPYYTTPRPYVGQRPGYQGGKLPMGSRGGSTPYRSGSTSVQVAVTCVLVAAAAFLAV